ncbi:MAG: primosomal protein N' [Acidobacteria bacterium]|nr:primosomal protein N' [Acidobacteriota bacterium]
MRLVEVAVAVPVHKTFTYTCSSDWDLSNGMRVLVPFGRKLFTGYVVGFPIDVKIDPSLLRPIRKALDFEPVLNSELLQLGFWLSRYYLAAPGEVFRSMLPTGLNFRGDYEIVLVQTPDQKSLVWDQDRIVAILEHGPIRFETLARRLGRKNLWRQVKGLAAEGLIVVRECLEEKSLEKTALYVNLGSQSNATRLTLLQTVALEKLRAMSLPVRLSELPRSGISAATIRSLQKKNLVRVEQRVVRRKPFQLEVPQCREFWTLNSKQKEAVRQMGEAVAQRRFQSFLLHGVTGSGKTEVYLHVIAQALELGRSALMLVPEIALTPGLAKNFQTWFGEHVAILHSALSVGERHDEWQRIRKNQARVVIGTRSAVFCPLQNLGIIIVDEEHDSSYKQEENPMYNGRDSALIRGRFNNAVVVLGSATPSLESYFQAREAGKHCYIAISERVRSRALPTVHIVDMRTEFQHYGKAAILSDLLKQGIAERLKRKEQIMVLLNRRGYAPVLLCRSCGHVLTCEHCSVTLTYHREGRRLRCHYCGYACSIPGRCPGCDGEYLFLVGEGTERVQEAIQGLFPGAVVDRLDRDATRVKGGPQTILRRFDSGETQILVGTQMIAKGHDFPNVTLVGVLNADSGLRIPDFRSAERTFQLITQVAGRSGRGQVEGEVIVQTYYPNHYALRYACMQDYHRFYQHEIRYRKLFSYPPFSSLANVVTQDSELKKCQQKATLFAHEVKQVLKDRQIEGSLRLLGPSEALLARLKGDYRYQTLLKARSRQVLHFVLEETLHRLEEKRINTNGWTIDVDPLQIL